jgi:hypothetical protein
MAALLTAAIVFGACASGGTSSARISDGKLHTLDSLYRAHDYFTLRDSLSGADTSAVGAGLYLAAVQRAFNHPLQSNETIDRTLRSDGLSDTLRFALRKLQMSNFLSQSSYRELDSLGNVILAAPMVSADPATTADIRNNTQLGHALSDVAPLRVTINGASLIRTDSARHVPLRIGDSLRSYVFDTGANLSVLMASEARALGLQIRPAALSVGNTTGGQVSADLAVAPTVRIGNVDYANVVFLVLPDKLLTFSNGFRIPGILGFPLIEGMGEVQFRRDGSLRIPATAADSGPRNLAMEELRPLTQINYGRDRLTCLLDSGAGESQLGAPYYLTHRAQVARSGIRDSIKLGGAGGASGERILPIYRVARATIGVGDTSIVLPSLRVQTTRLEDSKDELQCTIGLDVLRSSPAYTLNFKTMSLLLH